MSEASAASQLASVVRAQTANQARKARQNVKPQNAGRGVSISSQRANGSQASMQFDATGQVVPTAKGVNKHSATASFVDLLA